MALPTSKLNSHTVTRIHRTRPCHQMKGLHAWAYCSESLGVRQELKVEKPLKLVIGSKGSVVQSRA